MRIRSRKLSVPFTPLQICCVDMNRQFLKRSHPFREDKKNFKKDKVVHEVKEVPKFDGKAVEKELCALVPATSATGHRF